MAKKKVGKKTHRRRRRVGAAGNDTLELFLGAAVGALGGYVLLESTTILPTISAEIKSFFVGGAAYFVPKLMPGVLGTGIGVGLAGAAAIELGKSTGLVSGVMAGIAPGNSLSVVNGSRRVAGVAPGRSLSVVGGAPVNKIAQVMAGTAKGYYM